MANNLLDTGTYKVATECVRPPSAVNAPLPCGGLLQRSLTASGQVDQFTFTRQIGETVSLALVETAGFHSSWPFAQVFPPAGAPIESIAANGQRRFVAPATGTYVVQVMANNLLDVGSYNVGLECVAPISPVDGTLACNSSLPAPLAISLPGEVDQITFAGIAGRTFTLMMRESGFSAFANIIAPNGAVTTMVSGAPKPIATTAGTYLIQVMAGNLVSGGLYNLSLTCPAP